MAPRAPLSRLQVVDNNRNLRYNQKVKKLGGLRAAKRRLLRARDEALGPRRRLEVGAVQTSAARVVFMAGMAARGFSRQEAIRAWRSAPVGHQ